MKNTSINNVKNNMMFITAYYKKLTSYTKKNKSVGSINEWIVDNYYLLSEQEQTINEELTSLKVLKLKTKRREYLDNLINKFLEKQNYKLDTTAFFSYLNNEQVNSGKYFTYDEIDFINTAIKCNIIYKLKKLAEKTRYKFNEQEEVENKFKKISILLDQDPNADISKLLKIDNKLLKSNAKILEINQRINMLGDKAEEIFIELNNLLNNNKTSLKEIINSEYDDKTKENILMVDLISSFKIAIRFKIEDLYTNISFVEKALIAEKANVYDGMYEVSKTEYRNKIKTICKKEKKDEYRFITMLLKKAGDNHIGFLLFKEKKYELRSKIYVFSILLTTILADLIILKYLGILAFVLFLIPICGFITDIVTQILMSKVETRTLFRMKLEDYLPEKYSTAVVIPTIIKNRKKVEQMFDNLELYYLSNKSENLYFCLLGDVTNESTAKTKMDDEILKAGLDRAKKLNEKYGKNIFYFAYRNRFFNPSLNSYLGYERKRGALQHFNQLLLGKFNDEEKEYYFKGQTIDKIPTKVKYVITLDADTKLLLNTALKLIGTMIHPMNRPVLSNNEKKVVEGHAIMQPRVSIDVEVTNKSLYSQLFAGLGGLDIYSSKQFDLYQDVFGEGSFTGKGIYDLEIFDKLLTNNFPENLILSHDLLEGNYLRCGFISDIELFDGFPSKYLNDAARHHRWTRGDWQIAGWIKRRVLNFKNERVKNPLNLISKWKIFDNIVRSLKNPLLFLIVLFSVTLSRNPFMSLIIVFSIISLPLVFYLLHSLLSRQKYDLLLRYYLKIIWGLMSVFLKSIIIFALLPYEAILYMDAIIRANYRVHISKKNLLNWVISEDIDANNKNNFMTYIVKFKTNFFFGFALIGLLIFGYVENIYLISFLSILWITAPFIMFYISKDINNHLEYPWKEMSATFRTIAEQTWSFFNEHLTKDNNYLIPDNYQLNRNEKVDYRTSPTNIGFSITSVISAYELNFIDEGQAVDKINNIIKNVELLKKWHGHLYNWYDIKTRKELSPHFISTADSGNFVSSLYVAKGFLDKFNKYKSLKYRVKKLIYQTDFSKLYNEELEVFSIGYNVNEGTLVSCNYNNFLSEARLTSFIAIAKGDVPFKHWFRLDKTLTKHKWYKGIVSWSGTMFEYYMPLIFMKTYDHTLLDETYAFAYYAQKEFVKEVNPKLPWGISESAYNELDDSQNYKYKAFGIPYLKFHDSEIPQIVIAPYASIMAISKFPFEVHKNIEKFQKIGMQGKYGLFESYDHEDGEAVKSYFSHHQGMILSSITNHLKNNVIQNYFHSDKEIEAIEILLKEKVQIRTYIDLKIAKYKKYNYKRDIYENDMREQDGIRSIPEFGVLSNGFYSTFLNDRGIGFSKYKNLQISRYKKMSNQGQGLFVFIKDLDTKKIISNTYDPIATKPDHYHVVFASDRVKYVREDENLITTTEIMVTKDHNAEIRKIKIENTGNSNINLELTSYGEVIIARPEEDIAHQVFNNVTISAEIDEITSSLIFERRSRTKDNTKYFVINRFFTEEDDGLFEYETSRMDFIGRGNNISNPDAIFTDKKLSTNYKKTLEPIMSIRKNVTLKPNTKKVYYLLVGFGKSKDQVLEIVNVYNTNQKIEAAFEKATVLNNMRNRYAGLSGNEIRSYNSLLKYIYQPISDSNRIEYLKSNIMTQENLWKFGVSGDLPIILVEVTDSENFGFINDVLQSYEFYKSRAIYVDIVIVNKELGAKKEIVRKYINKLMYRINNLNYFENSPGEVKIIDDLTTEEFNLFKIVANLYFTGSQRKSLSEQISDVERYKTTTSSQNHKEDLAVINNSDKKFEFTNNGEEFVIYDVKTPMPWSNILTNKNFGSVITNSFGGFTYAYNSREFKLTSWSNDPVIDPSSETIYINGHRLVPNKVTHGFGYSIFESETEDLYVKTTVFVPVDDNVKLYDIKVESKNTEKFNFEFEVHPVLGMSEEITSRYLLTEFDNFSNSLIIKNNYNKIFKNEKMFLTSSENISSHSNDLKTKSISANINLKSNNRICFMLGCGNSYDIHEKYCDLDNVSFELNKTINYWKEKLSYLKIKTPDNSMNYLVNGWLLYQVYASRLYSKAAFYQVGGAIGFRDQLQDSMCLLYSDSEFTKKQILTQANHQFIEGDVLHWWHKEISFGARTRFSDDYLWLIYVTYEYIESTGDYSILDEKVSFVEGESLLETENEKGVTFTYSGVEESLYYHLKLAINKAVSQFGEHNLPLMGCGDWNDGMNKVGHLGKGESVWVGFFLYDLLIKMSILTTEEDIKEFYLAKASELKKSLNVSAWDKTWYLRAFYDNGDKLGSFENKECKIDLISQSWSILTGVADEQRIKTILPEVEKHLVDEETGIIKLLDPAFENPENNPGYISDYIPGIRENGAQYTHAALWYISALVKAKETKRAYKYFSMINPINKDSEIYKTEPYVIAADIYSNEMFKGQGGWSWYTGSASWTYKVAIEQILGIKKIKNQLHIKPNFPSEWENIEFEYKYMNSVYKIVINYSNEKYIVDLIDDGKIHEINLSKGSK